MFEWTQTIASLATQWLEQGNPIVFGALFLVSTVVEIGVPVPFVQDSVLLFLGYEPSGRLLKLAPLVMVVMMAGRIAGGSIVYWIARWLNIRFTRWLGKRSPRLLTSAQGLGARLGKRSPLAVTLARLTPGLLTPSSIAAGLFNIRYLHFVFGVMISSVIPDAAEIGTGLAIKAGFTVAGKTPTPTIFIFVLLGFTALVWLVNWLWRRFKSRKPPPQEPPDK
jgi:membrane protein DedA with SNARE-associated domain